MRCTQCGENNVEGDSHCRLCKAPLRAFRAIIGASDCSAPSPSPPSPGVVPSNWSQGTLQAVPQQSLAVLGNASNLASYPGMSPPVASGTGSVVSTGHSVYRNGQIEGRVILADAPFNEPPDFDVCRFINRLLWLVLLLVSPLLLLHWLLLTLGVLPALLATVIGCFLLFRFFSFTNLVSLVSLVVILNPAKRREPDLVPVRNFRIREKNSQNEIAVRMKGHLKHGSLNQDDIVTLQGEWRQGTLLLRRGYNHRTQSNIDLQASHSGFWLLATLMLMFLLFSFFYEPTKQVIHRMQGLGLVR